MTKEQQYHEYQNNGGTFTMEKWEQDGRYDPFEEPAYSNMDKLLMLHSRCVAALSAAKCRIDTEADDYYEKREEREAIINECAEAEAELLRFYDETPSFKIMIIPSH